MTNCSHTIFNLLKGKTIFILLKGKTSRNKRKIWEKIKLCKKRSLVGGMHVKCHVGRAE